MAYNVVDLIDKAINIAERRKIIYENIGKEKKDIPSIKVMSKVLANKVDKTIEYYKALKKELKDVEVEEIDFATYDKIAFLINEFNRRVYSTEVNNVREYLNLSLELMQDTCSLLVDVQGRFVKNKSDVHTKTYKILTDIIKKIQGHIAGLEKTLEQNF